MISSPFVRAFAPAAFALTLLGSIPQASAEIAVSNLAERLENVTAIADLSTGDGDRYGSDSAQAFTVGSISATLTSVTLRMEWASAGNGGFRVALWSDAGGSPGARLAMLTGHPSPIAAGDFTYINQLTPRLPLVAGTTYWVVASVLHTPFVPAYREFLWAVTDSGAETGSPGWTIANDCQTIGYTNGVPDAWFSYPGLAQQMRIDATLVPEPSALALLLASAALLSTRRPDH